MANNLWVVSVLQIEIFACFTVELCRTSKENCNLGIFGQEFPLLSIYRIFRSILYRYNFRYRIYINISIKFNLYLRPVLSEGKIFDVNRIAASSCN